MINLKYLITVLKDEARLFCVRLIVLLLAIDAAIVHDFAELTDHFRRFATNFAHLIVDFLDLRAHLLIRYATLVVVGVGFGAELEELNSEFLAPSPSRNVQCRVILIIEQIRVRSMVNQ